MSHIPASDPVFPHRFVIDSNATRHIYKQMQRYAPRARTVLLVGETGVGKDSIAREIHLLSTRRNQPFISVPLSSMTESLIDSELFGHEKGAFTGATHEKAGIFEAAAAGTLYFPEISEIPQHIQLKLLHFLQYRTFRRVGHNPRKPEIVVDVFIIFASNVDLGECLMQKKIRRDFYYRINKHCIVIPPLRERIDGIASLADHFAGLYGKMLCGKRVSFSPGTIQLLQQYHWPGNVRELESIIERTLIDNAELLKMNGDELVIQPEHIAGYLTAGKTERMNPFDEVFTKMYTLPDYHTVIRECDRAYLTALLHRNGKDREAIVRTAGYSMKTLKRKLNKYGLNGYRMRGTYRQS
jgi:transcriptional regulator with GAF, ATPase, and Fis domain